MKTPARFAGDHPAWSGARWVEPSLPRCRIACAVSASGPGWLASQSLEATLARPAAQRGHGGGRKAQRGIDWPASWGALTRRHRWGGSGSGREGVTRAGPGIAQRPQGGCFAGKATTSGRGQNGVGHRPTEFPFPCRREGAGDGHGFGYHDARLSGVMEKCGYQA